MFAGDKGIELTVKLFSKEDHLSHLRERYHRQQFTSVRSLQTPSVLVANPKKLLYAVANPARGLLNREKIIKEKVWQRNPPPSTLLVINRRN